MTQAAGRAQAQGAGRALQLQQLAAAARGTMPSNPMSNEINAALGTTKPGGSLRQPAAALPRLCQPPSAQCLAAAKPRKGDVAQCGTWHPGMPPSCLACLGGVYSGY
jgi:hypothetical protein